MDLPLVLITLGALFLLGLVADEVGRRTRLPRVTLLLAIGVAAGSSGFDLLPEETQRWYDLLAITALTMVAFLLGGSLRRDALVRNGRTILAVSVMVVLATIAIVGAGLWMLGFGLTLSLILAAIGTATDPAATADVIRQAGAKAEFAAKLKGIVAIDDAWGLLAFSLVLVVVGTLNGDVGLSPLRSAGWEIGGALALGLGIGLPTAFASGRLRRGEPMQTEALGVVFLTAGVSIWLEVSFLIAGMTVGATVVNLARHHNRAFHEIEQIEWPFMVLFFIIAGASLQTDRLAEVGWIGAAYILLRILARLAGGWMGGWIGGAPKVERRWFGVALLPQAGVALGMALVAADRFPEMGQTILTLTIGTTVVFELLGPLVTLLALRRVANQEGPVPPPQSRRR